MEKELIFLIANYSNKEEYQKAIQIQCDELKRQGYRDKHGEPIEEIRVIHKGYKITMEKV